MTLSDYSLDLTRTAVLAGRAFLPMSPRRGAGAAIMGVGEQLA